MIWQNLEKKRYADGDFPPPAKKVAGEDNKIFSQFESLIWS